MVVRQILALNVRVRILAGQQSKGKETRYKVQDRLRPGPCALPAGRLVLALNFLFKVEITPAVGE